MSETEIVVVINGVARRLPPPEDIGLGMYTAMKAAIDDGMRNLPGPAEIKSLRDQLRQMSEAV